MTAQTGEGQVVEIGGGWAIPTDDARHARQVTWLLPEFRNLPEAEIAGRENGMANYLVASGRYDLVHIERQDRIVDYRREGAEYDRKTAKALARKPNPD